MGRDHPARETGGASSSDPSHREECLDAVLRTGFVLLSEVPVEPGTVLEVAASLRLRTRDQLRPAVRRAGRGHPGQSGLHRVGDQAAHRQPVPRPGADGAAAALPVATRWRVATPVWWMASRAAELCATRIPAAFGTLPRKPRSPFGYVDERDRATGQPAADRAQPARPGPRGPVQQPVDAAAARGRTPTVSRVLHRLQAVGGARSPAGTAARPCGSAPGDCLVFDNTRVLHARTAFSTSPGSPGGTCRAATPTWTAWPAPWPSVAPTTGGRRR